MNLELTKAEKIAIGVIIGMIILIPGIAYVLSQTILVKPTTSKLNQLIVPPKEVAKKSPLQDLQENLKNSTQAAVVKEAENTDSSMPEVYYGPTLSFKLNIEGRPSSDQSTKVFVGIAAGAPSGNPSYLLSFNVNIPNSGEYKGLSLAGLTSGSTYTAYIKGPSQIATSSAFQVRTTVSDIGLLNLTTGDLNEDNTIDSQDQNLIRASSGATKVSSKWNASYDFNLDGIINNFDLGFVNRNLGKTGAGGAWYSRINYATKSAELGLKPNTGGKGEAGYQQAVSSDGGEAGYQQAVSSDGGEAGYWIWVPKF